MVPLSSLSPQEPHGTFLALDLRGEMGIEGLISSAISLFNRHWDGIILMAIIFIIVIYLIFKGKKTNAFNNVEEPIDEFYLKHNMTPREKEITCLLLKGKTGPDIGKELFISQNTARNHIHHIYKKLKVSNRVESS